MTSLSSQYFFLTGYRVFMMIIVAVAVGGLFAILKYTRLGMRIRAGTRDLDTVSTLGVNVRVLRSLNFGIGIYMAGLAGVLAAGLLDSLPPSAPISSCQASSRSSWAASAVCLERSLAA